MQGKSQLLPSGWNMVGDDLKPFQNDSPSPVKGDKMESGAELRHHSQTLWKSLQGWELGGSL